jgi:hypothetical protein
MNLPGFTAEASLYGNRLSYRFLANGAYLNAKVYPTALTKPIMQGVEDWLECVDNCTDDCPDDWSSIRCGAHCAYTCTFPSGSPGSQPSNGGAA